MWQFISFLVCLCAAQRASAQDQDQEQDPEVFSYYVTRPDIEAPKWFIQTYDAEALQQDSYWFIAPYFKLEQNVWPKWNGPHIYRTDGELVWSGGSVFDYTNTHDFRVSEMPNGKKVLSLIRGPSKDGKTRASGSLWDDSYTEYRSLDLTANDYHYVNMHDLNIINDGKTALALLHERTTLIPIPGTNVTCKAYMDGFMEIDMVTNDILFEWSARGHVPLNESDVFGKGTNTVAHHCKHSHKTKDALHPNSIDKFPDGDYLLSARNTDALYKISHKDGSIVWRLGGINSDFEMSEETRFERQHHSRVLSQNSTHALISVFDNASKKGFLAGEAITDTSAGLILALRTDTTPMTVDLVSRFQKPYWNTDFSMNNKTDTRGSFQMLENGNAFLGLVSHCHVAEYSPDGRLLQQAATRLEEVASYRSYKFKWEGKPAAPPDVVVQKGESEANTKVYVSWNGATNVAKWKVLKPGWMGVANEVLAEGDSAGFETAFTLNGTVEKVVLAGYDSEGQELGRSLVTTPEGAEGHNSSSHLSPWVWMVLGVVIGIFIFLGVVWRKAIFALLSGRSIASYRPVAGVDPEADVLLYERGEEEGDEEAGGRRYSTEKSAVELEEYNDLRSSGEVSDKPR